MLDLLLDFLWRGPGCAFAVTLGLALVFAPRGDGAGEGTDGRGATLLAFAAGSFLSIGLLWSFPSLTQLPREAMERVLPLLLLVTLLAAGTLRRRRPMLLGAVRFLAGVGIGIAFLWNVLRRAEPQEIALVGGTVGALFAFLWASIERSCGARTPARPGRAMWMGTRVLTAPLALALVAALGAHAILATGTAEWAKFSGTLAAGCFALGVARALRPGLDPSGAAGPVALAFLLAWMTGTELSELPRVSAACLAAAACVPAWIVPPNGSRAREVLFVLATAALAGAGLALALTLHEEFDYTNY